MNGKGSDDRIEKLESQVRKQRFQLWVHAVLLLMLLIRMLDLL